MTKEKLYQLTKNLYQCSMEMKEINEVCSDLLLDMSKQTLKILSRDNLPEDVKLEVMDIKSEILGGGDE